MDTNTLKREIATAFADVEYPGDWCLRGSNEGEEPYLLEQEFRGLLQHELARTEQALRNYWQERAAYDVETS